MFKTLKIEATKILFCCENTGIYVSPLLVFTQKNKLHLWVESPLSIKKSLGLTRGKSDKADAQRIASYAYYNEDAHTRQKKLAQENGQVLGIIGVEVGKSYIGGKAVSKGMKLASKAKKGVQALKKEEKARKGIPKAEKLTAILREEEKGRKTAQKIPTKKAAAKPTQNLSKKGGIKKAPRKNLPKKSELPKQGIEKSILKKTSAKDLPKKGEKQKLLKEKLSKKAQDLNLNLTSPISQQVIENLELTVDEFIAKFRKERLARGERSVHDFLSFRDTSLEDLHRERLF